MKNKNKSSIKMKLVKIKKTVNNSQRITIINWAKIKLHHFKWLKVNKYIILTLNNSSFNNKLM